MGDDFLFGDIAVQEGFLTRDQVEACARDRDGRPLGEALVQKGLLTPDQVASILSIQRIHVAETTAPSESEGVLRQDRHLIPCPGCDTYYLVHGHPEGSKFACRKCHRVLVVRRSRDGSLAPQPPATPRGLGDYDLLQEIDRGSAAVVHKAVHRASGRIVALKVLRDRHAADAARLRRFQLEAETARRLNHPGIVALRDAGEAGGEWFIAFDFVEGETLDRALSRGDLTVARFVEILEKVARAVHYAHENGVVHRDLKPANIILDPQGKPHVADFGLAKVSHESDGGSTSTKAGASLGTPHYMSPEQVQGDIRGTDSRSDIYALGVILYQGLTGRLPFPGGSVTDVYFRILAGQPPKPSSVNPRIPRDLEATCLKALDLDKARRHASARDFAEELRRHLAGGGGP
ncbi:MAG TPA: protein kinase [Planctomycetota bacterium]